MIRFTVPGLPQGKGRARISTRNGSPRAYTPLKTVMYESLIALAGQDAMEGRPPIEGPVYLHVTATFPIAPSWTKRRKAEIASGMAWHTSKPDGDNIAKSVGDGLNGIAFKDDSQVALCKVLKVYGDKPGLDVMVEAL